MQMERNAQAVFDWAIVNGLELNARKFKAIIFGSSQNLTRKHSRNHNVFGPPIPYVEQVKNLGLLMTPTLNW